MKIITLNTSNFDSAVAQAAQTLKSGGLVVYPTETCYGLGVDATNPDAVAKLLQFKTRREGKAFSVAMSNQAMAEKYVDLNDTARNFYTNFLPGPLTIVSKVKNSPLTTHNSQLASGISSEFNTLGIRIPDHPLALALVRTLSRPITATSANVSYQASPYSLKQWLKQTPRKSQDLIDLWLDAGDLPIRPPSTIIDTTLDELTILRQGEITLTNIKHAEITRSVAQTHQLAAQIVKCYMPVRPLAGSNVKCLIIGLQGELGAGKTQFAQGLARSLKISQPVTSPTFTLVHEYLFKKFEIRNSKFEINGMFYHIDTWRIEKPEELLDLKFSDMLQPGNVVLIEWIEKVAEVVEKLAQEKNASLIWGTVEVLDQTTRRWSFSEQRLPSL